MTGVIRDLRELVREVAARLEAAGVPSPRNDAEELVAEILCGTDSGSMRGWIAYGDSSFTVDDERGARLEAAVARRESREPLQHILGWAAFRQWAVEVGPGVFTPRPETELVAGAAVDAALARAESTDGDVTVVDLCSGSGAIAKSVAGEVPEAMVIAVELSDDAIPYLERNTSRMPNVSVVHADAVTFRHGGPVDIVVSNPPYIPPDAEPTEPEVRDHDPAQALYGLGDDGLQVPRGVIDAAWEMLVSGGVLIMEHADVQGAAARAYAESRGFEWCETRRDLTGRDRFLVAIRP